MNKKGFTLTELLVVIALIAVLALLVVPNVMQVRNNINERLYSEKEDYIVSAAEMYASNNPDLFASGDIVTIKLSDLINAGYLTTDGSGAECNYYYKEPAEDSTDTEGTIEAISTSALSDKGCVLDPRYGTSLNDLDITITRKNVGIVAEIRKTNIDTIGSQSLVGQVCGGFGTNYIGKTSDTNDYCMCDGSEASSWRLVKATYNDQTNVFTPTNTEVQQCILVSNKENGDIDNWVKYGATTANWRVVGLYKVNGNVVAKIITSSIVQ